MTQITVDNKSLPATIEATLRNLIRRARAAIIVRGVLLTLATAIIGMLASMGIAVSWLPSEPWQHYGLTFLWVGVAALAAFVWLVRPLAKSFSLAGIARVIEQRHPELQERLSSTVELLSSGDSPEIRGSQTLIDALAAEAVGDARAVRPKREITFRRVRPPLYVLGGAVVVILVLLLLYPMPVGRLLAKTVAPYLNLPNIYADNLRITPGDCVLAEGMRLEVTTSIIRENETMRAKVRSARMRIERTDGTKNIFDMTAMPDGSFVYTSGPLSADGPWGETFRYRIGAGDAQSQYYRVKVVPLPAAKSIEVGYKYPDYMHRPETSMLAGPGLITGPAGAVAAVRVRLNKPAADAELSINETAAEITRIDPMTYAFTHNLSKEAGGKWKLLLTDEHGFRSDPLGGEIIVKPDAPPNVRILQPDEREKLKLRPTDRLPVTCSLADDFGISRTELLLSIDGREQKTVNLNVAATTAPALTCSTMLDLASLDLIGAQRVTFKVKAWDNLPKTLGGPQEGTSQTRTIELDVKASAYTFQVQLALDIRLREALQRIYEELQTAKKISEPLRRSMPDTKELTGETTGKIDRMRESLLSAEEISRSLAELAAGTYPEVSVKLTKLADDHVGKARELAGLVKITDAQKQRGELADEADFQIDRALAVVSELLKELQVLTDLAERAVALEELARRQEELAAAKMPTTQPFDAAQDRPGAEGLRELTDRQWQQAERQVAADTAEMVRRTPPAMHEALDTQGKQTTDLAEAARKLQQAQQALAKSADDEQGIAEMKKQLRQLAAEQAELARQTSQMARQSEKLAPTTAPPAAEATKTTAQAAEALTTTQPASALTHQDAAVKSLEQTARQASAEQLASATEAMAKQQEDLAKRSEGAREFQQQAQTARQAAAENQAKQKQLQTEVAKRLSDLAERQSALEKQAQQLEKETNPSQQSRPAKAMSEAASNLRTGDADRARTQAAQAADQARKLSDELSQRAEAASQADIANIKAKEAEQLAQQQARLAEDVAAAAGREAPTIAAAQQAGQKAAAQQSDAEKASGKIQDLTRQQSELARQVGELKELAKQATQQAAAAMSRNDPSGNMQAAAGRLQRNLPDQATKPQTDAAGQLRQLAQEARGTGSKPVPPTTAGNIAAGARKLAQQQEQLRQRTAELTGKLAGAQRQRREQELARLRAEQQKIAREAAALSDDIKSQAPQGDRIDTNAARSAAEASEQLADNRLSQAAESAGKAGGKLGELARRLEKAQTDTPHEDARTNAESRGDLAERAGNLAQRQQQAGRQIADLAAEKMSQVLAGRQGQITEQTKVTAEDVELLKEHIAELLPDAQAEKLAQSAAKSLQQAVAAQGQAGLAMSSDQPGQSIPSQQASAQSLAQAAEALAQLGRQFAAQAEKNPPAPADDKGQGEQLAEAYDATQSAAQNQSAGQAAKAARLLAELAKQALQQANAMGMAPGATGMRGTRMARGSTLDSDARVGTGQADLREGELIELGISADDWARLPGRLQNQVLQAARISGPEEYQILIKRYFRALAKKAAEPRRAGADRKEETK